MKENAKLNNHLHYFLNIYKEICILLENSLKKNNLYDTKKKKEILSIIYYIAKKIEHIPYKTQKNYPKIKWQYFIKENEVLKTICKDRNLQDVDSIRTELLKLKKIIQKILKDLTDQDYEVFTTEMNKTIKKKIIELNDSI